MARYRNSGLLTDRQLRTIEALWIRGLSQNTLAKIESVKPSAIACRIDALGRRAPEFFRWWRLKNQGRRRR